MELKKDLAHVFEERLKSYRTVAIRVILLRDRRETTKNMSHPGRPVVSSEKKMLQLLRHMLKRGSLEDLSNISGMN